MKGLAHHQLDVYGTRLHLVSRRKAWGRMREQMSCLDEEAPVGAGQTQTVTWEPNQAGLIKHHVVVWINLRTHAGDVAELVNTLAHEASHVVDVIMDHIGERAPAAEQRAYLTGWVTGWLWDNVQDDLEG